MTAIVLLVGVTFVSLFGLRGNSGWSADGFDPTGRTRPSWADSVGPQNVQLHIVERYYQWTSTSPGAANGVWLTQERWVVFDEHGAPALIATETTDSTGTLVRGTYANAEIGIARDWVSLDGFRRALPAAGPICERTAPGGFLDSAAPARPDTAGMIASGYEEAEPGTLAALDDAVAQHAPQLAQNTSQVLHAEFDGYDEFADAPTVKTRSYYLDADGLVTAYRGATYVGGTLVGERLSLTTTTEVPSLQDEIDRVHSVLEEVCGQ